MFGGDDIGALVLDTGSDTIKAGHSGEDAPKAVFSSYIGRVDEPDTDSNQMIDETTSRKARIYVARDALHRRDNMRMSPSIRHGQIEDWDGLEALLSHSFRNHLSLDPSNHPVLWSEPTSGSKSQRERMLQMLMEKFQLPAVFFCRSVVLTAFAAGRSTAMICESGAGITTVAPVHEGYVLTKGVKRTKLAGDALDAIVQQLICHQPPVPDAQVFDSQPKPLYSLKRTYLDDQLTIESSIPSHTHPSYHRFAQRELLQDIKQSVCRLSELPFDLKGPRLPSVNYELPDGNTFEIGNERFVVAEHLFAPNVMPDVMPRLHEFDSGFTFNGLHSMIRSSVESVDVDLHKELYSSLVCAGGTSLVTGFASRLSRDLALDLPAAHKVKVVVGATTNERKYASWIGGSILGSLGTFHQMWASKQEYEEQGNRLLAKFGQ